MQTVIIVVHNALEEISTLIYAHVHIQSSTVPVHWFHPKSSTL